MVWVPPLDEASHLGLLLYCDSLVTMSRGRWKAHKKNTGVWWERGQLQCIFWGVSHLIKSKFPITTTSSAPWPGFASDGIKGSSCCPLIFKHEKYKPSFCCSLFWSRCQLHSQLFLVSMCSQQRLSFFSLRITVFLKTNKQTSIFKGLHRSAHREYIVHSGNWHFHRREAHFSLSSLQWIKPHRIRGNWTRDVSFSHFFPCNNNIYCGEQDW